MNIPRLEKKQYFLELYLNIVKAISRNKTNIQKLSGNKTHIIYFYGINSKDVYTRNDEITLIKDIEYEALNNCLAYIVAQLLYEQIENAPYTLQLSPEEERQVKQVRYYLNRCYYNTWHLVREYLTCNERKITKRFKNIGFSNLREVENKIKKV